jgi:HK97 family phage major capsid protein
MPFQVTIENEAAIASLSPTEVRKAIAERSEMLSKIFSEAGENLDPSKVTSIEVKDGHDLARQIEARNNELAKLGERASEFDKIESAKAAANRWQEYSKGYDKDPNRFAPRGDGDRKAAPAKSFGQLFVESPLYEAAKNRRPHSGVTLDVKAEDFLERKAVFETGAGWAPESLRTGRVVLNAQREVEVTDALPLFPTTMAAIVYMEETTFTNSAAERAEGGAYVESALELTERSVTVRSIGTSLPVTDEQLADVDGVRAYLDQRLGFMVRQKLDSQILVGDGTPPALLGTLNVAGINSQAKGTDSAPDAIYKGIKAARITGRSQPNVVIIHPNDWEPIRLLKTADGVYIWGSPSEAGPARIWGLPVIETTAVTENTAIAGDYARFAGLHIRQGLEVATGFVNDDFLDGRVTIRAGIRAAVVHYRPKAFTQITGL